MERNLNFDWSKFTERDYQNMQRDLQTSHDAYRGSTNAGFIAVNDAALDIFYCPGDGSMLPDIYLIGRYPASPAEAVDTIGPFAYGEELEPLNSPVNEAMTIGILKGTLSYLAFQEQFEANVRKIYQSPELRETAEPGFLAAMNHDTGFWQHVSDYQEQPERYETPKPNIDVYQELATLVETCQKQGVPLAAIGAALMDTSKNVLQKLEAEKER